MDVLFKGDKVYLIWKMNKEKQHGDEESKVASFFWGSE
jgi:hypothetical protein